MTTTQSETLADPLASEIIDAHNRAANLVENARDRIKDAIDSTFACAALVDAARAEWGTGFKSRWRDEVGLPDAEASRYLSIHHAASRRIDKRQLFLIGIIDPADDEPEHHQRTPDPFAWCRWVPKVREALGDEQIARMSQDQREVARKTLEPLVELYEKLA